MSGSVGLPVTKRPTHRVSPVGDSSGPRGGVRRHVPSCQSFPSREECLDAHGTTVETPMTSYSLSPLPPVTRPRHGPDQTFGTGPGVDLVGRGLYVLVPNVSGTRDSEASP